MGFRIAAFYKFTPLEPAAHREALLAAGRGADVRGTILLAREGLNGTISGPDEGIDRMLDIVRALPGCGDLEWKEAHADAQPFRRLKVRLKHEIVTFGRPTDPAKRVGTFVAPEDWNAVIDDPGTVVIDTRNDYEIAIGSFRGAVDPGIGSFREFGDWWARNAARFANKRIAMFCTGGIRCEKASNWLLAEGVPEVLHLKGGILKYLEEVPAARSAWTGACYVFDDRVAVGHGLRPGEYSMCHACGRPVSALGRTHADYRPGVSCAACIDAYTDTDRARFAERQRQIELGAARAAGSAGGPPGAIRAEK